FFSFLPLRHPTSTLFPYTTLFRSDHPGAVAPVRRLRARAGAAPSAGENVGGRPVTARTKGLVVAALHIALVSALGAKLLADRARSEEHTSELQSRFDLVCRLLLEK